MVLKAVRLKQGFDIGPKSKLSACNEATGSSVGNGSNGQLNSQEFFFRYEDTKPAEKKMFL